MEDDFGIIDLSKPLKEDEDQTDDFGISVLPEPNQTDDFGIPDLSAVSDAPPVSVSDQPSLKSDALPIDPTQVYSVPFAGYGDFNPYESEYQAIELAKQAEAEAQKKAYLAEREELKTQIIQDQMLNAPAPNVDIPVIGGEFKGGPQDFSTAFKYGDLTTRGNIQNLFADTEVELGGTGFMQFNQNMQNKLLPAINSVRSLVGAEPLPEDASLRASIMKEIELERSAKSYLKAAEGLGFKPQRFGEIENFSDFISWAKTTAGASGSPMLASMASFGMLSPVVLGAELDANLREIEGLSREDRVKLAYRGGLIAGLLENLGIGVLIKGVPDELVGKLGVETLQKYAQQTYGGRVAQQFVQVAAAEGLIEVGQEGTFIAIESGAGKEFKPGEIGERLTEAGAGGFVIGGPLGGARAAVTETSSKADKEAKAFIDSIDQAQFDQTPEQAALTALSDPTNEILVDAPQAQTDLQQPIAPSADASTVDVTEQSDPTVKSDDPTDLVAPTKAEPPKVDATPITKPEIKTEPPVQPVTPEQKDETPQVNPQEATPIGTDTDKKVTKVQTPDGQKNYNVTGKVVELADLKQAEGQLQPRDRSKKESAVLATQRAGTMFNPERLLNDPTSGSGAPIIARDGTIMSGNGRVLTMQEVYANQPKSLEAYQTALKEAGINTEGFSQPVFVRQLNDNMTVDQLKEFADLSNTEAQAQMTSTETAQRDAKRMPQKLINLFTGGDVTSIENKSFVTGFAVQVLSPTEQGQFSVNGKPTKNAIDRMRAAILATAYDDTDTLSIMLDSTDDNIKAISSAMMSSAPQLSQLKADIKEGNVKPDFDISKQIAEAAKTISNLRDQKVKPRDYFDQQDAFSQTDPLTEAIIKAFYNDELTRAKSQKFMTDVLNFYVEESSKRQENALFEDDVTPKDVVTAARKKAERKADGTDENQGSLLAEAIPSKSVNESRKQTQSPKRTRSSKRLDAEQSTAEVQEDELAGSTSDPSNVLTTTSGFVFDNVSQTLRQSIYRDAFADSGLSVDAFENKSTEAKFKILSQTIEDKFGLSGVKAPKGGGYTQVNQLLDAYHNLQWMTHSLAMPNTFIGLNGKLSLELPDTVGRYLGAFESGSNNVIMPQRSNSFAHEFGHALDYYLMDKYGNLGFMESSRGISGLIRATAKAGDKPWQDGTPVNVETAFGNMINALFLDNAELSFKVMQLEQAIAKGEARGAKTGVKTKSLDKLRSQLKKLLEGSGRSKIAPTKFKETSAQFGKSVGMQDYFLRPTEMFARAFEAYIARTVEAAGGRNEFITKGDEAYKLAADQVKGADDRLALSYPKDHERHNIFLAMDRLMDALRTESIAEGTVAEAPGDTDMIDARANFWGSMQYEERSNMKDIPKRVVQSIINDQKRAHRIAQGRAETLKLRPQKYAGNNLLERKINEYRDQFGGNFINTKRQILLTISDQNKDNKQVRDIMENIISKVATDPGTRQDRVTQQTGTFEEATRIETRRFYAIYDQIAKKYDMDLLTDAEEKSLRLLLTGESEATAKASPKTLKLAGELRRQLLNPIYDYMVKSGQDINYVQGVGYMPRMLDAPLAIQEKPDFMGELEGKKGAVPLYQQVIFENEYGVFKEGDLDQIKALVKLAMSNPDKTDLGNLIADEYSDLRDIAEVMREQIKEINRLEKTIEEDPSAELAIQEIMEDMEQEHFKLHEELRDPYALVAANDWHRRISAREGADPSTNGVQGSYAKKRKLPPETDKYMNDFYLNPTDALMQYIPSAVRSTEYNKLFGKDLVPVGRKMKDGVQIDYLEYLIDEAKMAGMATHQAQEVNSIVQMVTGRYPGPDGSLNKALNTINTFGTMALLPRAVLSSVAEPITAAIQTGSTVQGFKNFILAFDGLGTSLRGKDAVERKMYYAQLANILGVIDLPQTGEVVANRLGGTVAEDAKNTMRLATFFLRTGLTNITIAQRKSSMRIGIQYIIEQAAQYNNPDVSESAKAEARQTLRDFAVNDTILSQFTEFAQNLDKTENGLYEIDQIMDVDGSLTDMGRVLATAVNRFVDQTIQDPKIIDRPKWAETPIGRIVFGIQSFIAAFQRNVLEMSVKRAARDFKTQGAIGGSTRLARKMMLPLFSLYVGHTLVSAAREFVFNRDKWEEEKEEEDRYIPLKYLMQLGISRSGLLGRADPVFNGFFSLKYQADLSNVAVGATGAYYLKAIQRIVGIGVENSPDTVSREYQAVRGLYDILVPALAGGLATIPGVSNLLGYGLGVADMAVTSPSVKHWVTRNIIYQMYNETYRPGQSSSNRGSSGFGSGGFGSKGFGN